MTNHNGDLTTYTPSVCYLDGSGMKVRKDVYKSILVSLHIEERSFEIMEAFHTIKEQYR